MKSVRSWIPLWILSASLSSAALAHEITRFEVVARDCREAETSRLVRATRSFHIDGLPRFLITDADTFRTRLIDPSRLDCDDPSAAVEMESSAFGRALRQGTAAPFPTRNDGVTRASRPVNGVFLSADLCPASRERFEFRFFDELERITVRTGSPVPVALAVSGKWIRGHAADFEAIRRLVSTRKIDVTWVNHSDSHPYHPGEKDAANFLLRPGLEPNREIEAVERELLANGEIPSPFFRFPGLVSDRKWIEILAQHSLIPVGADAWLALGQVPKAGSIILVHANGNEPEGVARFLKTVEATEALGPFLPLPALF